MTVQLAADVGVRVATKAQDRGDQRDADFAAYMSARQPILLRVGLARGGIAVSAAQRTKGVVDASA